MCWGSNGVNQVCEDPTDPITKPRQISLPGSPYAVTAGGAGLSPHSCAAWIPGSSDTIIASNVRCWGGGSLSGSVDLTGFSVPLLSLSSGAYHICAITADQEILCWGSNTSGQLGNGSTINSIKPSTVPDLRAIAVAAGEDHTCVITRDNSVWCWGANGSGQLGTGSTESSNTPLNVPTLKAVAISAGNGFTCALDTDGHVQC